MATDVRPVPAPSNKCWSIRQVAEYLGVSVKTIRRMVDEGKFPRGKRFAGRTIRWRSDQVVNWFDRRPAA